MDNRLTPIGQAERFSTNGVPARERAEHWSNMLAHVHFRTVFEPRDSRNFNGSMTVRQLGESRLSMVEVAPARFTRSRRDALRDMCDNFIVTTCIQGGFTAVGGNARITCSAGELAIADAATAFEFSHDLPLRTLSINFSRSMVAATCPTFLDSPLRAVAVDSARRRVAVRLLRVLFEEAGDRDNSAGDMDDATVLLLRAFETQSASPYLSPHQARLLTRAERIMRAHLASPINVAIVAQDMRISANYLQKLFRQSGTTFSLRLRALRLERAHKLLQDRRKTGVTITDVMFACGFQTPEHFARTYRARFGRPPSAT